MNHGLFSRRQPKSNYWDSFQSCNEFMTHLIWTDYLLKSMKFVRTAGEKGFIGTTNIKCNEIDYASLWNINIHSIWLLQLCIWNLPFVDAVNSRCWWCFKSLCAAELLTKKASENEGYIKFWVVIVSQQKVAFGEKRSIDFNSTLCLYILILLHLPPSLSLYSCRRIRIT